MGTESMLRQAPAVGMVQYLFKTYIISFTTMSIYIFGRFPRVQRQTFGGLRSVGGRSAHSTKGYGDDARQAGPFDQSYSQSGAH